MHADKLLGVNGSLLMKAIMTVNFMLIAVKSALIFVSHVVLDKNNVAMKQV